MKLRIGYELDYDFPQPTPLILMLNVHFSRFSDLEAPDYMRIRPSVPVRAYRDGFGNWCTRLVAPQGRMRITADAVISDSGLPEAHDRSAGQGEGHRITGAKRSRHDDNEDEKKKEFHVLRPQCATAATSRLPGWPRISATASNR